MDSRESYNSKTVLFIFAAGLCLAGMGLSRTALSDTLQFITARSQLESQGGSVRESPVNGRAAFVTVAGLPASKTAQAAPADQLDFFLDQYGAVFGLSDHRQQLRRGPRIDISAFSSFIQMIQTHQGMPVLGGVLKAHFDSAGDLHAMNGLILEDFPDIVAVVVTAEEAVQIALNAFWEDKIEDPAAGIVSRGEREIWYHDGMLQNLAGQIHRVYEINIGNDQGSVRTWYYIDVATGKILNRIEGVHTAMDRSVSETTLGNVVWTETDTDPIPAAWAGGSAQQVTDWQNEIDGARESYNLFSSMTSGTYLSFDGADSTMLTVNNSNTVSCPNALWNGVSTNYCTDVTADDIVVHEWGHAVTEYTTNLIYQWQSGALNESYSDIWGETADILNGRLTDAPGAARTNATCSSFGAGAPTENSLKWLVGEDSLAIGVIRDMWHPECLNDPGSVTSADYHCSDSDSGGVHSNSGVPNRAFALMVDGDSALSITGLGITKAAHIHWNAINMLTPASNFVDHADALEASCTALIDIDLPALDVIAGLNSLSGEKISAADCVQLGVIVSEVELRTAPDQCNFQPLLTTPAPALCTEEGAEVNTDFLEDFESGVMPAGWSVGTRAVTKPSTFSTPNWAVTASLPVGATGSNAVFGANPVEGDCSTDLESGVIWLQSPEIILSADDERIAFDHWVATENGWDGGNIKVSVNNGSWTLVPLANFSFNGYNATLNFSWLGNTNPLAGQSAFTSSNGGEVSGSWGQSQLSLAGIAEKDDSVRLIFELGMDDCNGLIGWYVDQVQAYECVVPTDEMFINGFE